MGRIGGILICTVFGIIGAMACLLIAALAASLIVTAFNASPMVGFLSLILIIAGGVFGGLFAWRTS